MTDAAQVNEEISEEERQQLTRKALGEQLRRTREDRDMTLDKASEQLRIRKVYLQGLENGDWGALPEEVYIMGFLRQYAALLGADIKRHIEELKPGEYKLTKPFTIPDPPIALNRSWAVAAGACFLLLFLLFNAVDDGEEDVTPQSLQVQAPASVQPPAALPDSPPPAESVAADKASPPSSRPSLNTPAIADLPVSDTPETSQSTASTSDNTHDNVIAPVDGLHSYRLTAIGENVWLQLHAANGELIKEALLRDGQTLKLKSAETQLLLTCGNPVALRVEIDGALAFDAGQLGKKNKVLHNFRLQAASAQNTTHP